MYVSARECVWKCIYAHVRTAGERVYHVGIRHVCSPMNAFEDPNSKFQKLYEHRSFAKVA